jgi:hypothetical protein
MWWFVFFFLLLVSCISAKNPYYQDELIEIEGQECTSASVDPPICEYQINYRGTTLVVPEEAIKWK